MIIEAYKYLRWLSLDIVLGAIIFLAFLGDFYNLNISLSIYFGLSSAVWLIYTADHLIDSKRASTSPRRLFHRRSCRQLQFVAGIVLVAALFNVYFLPFQIIRNGSILAGCCVGYLMIVFFFRKLWFKEMLVAIGYASGVFLAPFTLNHDISNVDFLILFQLFLVALINLLLFSIYDIREDVLNGFGSFPGKMGKGKSKRIVNLLILISAILVCFAMVSSHHLVSIQVVFLMMTLVLSAIHWYPDFFSNHERFRIVGDAVFLIPLLFLL